MPGLCWLVSAGRRGLGVSPPKDREREMCTNLVTSLMLTMNGGHGHTKVLMNGGHGHTKVLVRARRSRGLGYRGSKRLLAAAAVATGCD